MILLSYLAPMWCERLALSNFQTFQHVRSESILPRSGDSNRHFSFEPFCWGCWGQGMIGNCFGHIRLGFLRNTSLPIGIVRKKKRKIRRLDKIFRQASSNCVFGYLLHKTALSNERNAREQVDASHLNCGYACINPESFVTVRLEIRILTNYCPSANCKEIFHA